MQCPDCGAYIGDEDRFCGECGRPVEHATASGVEPRPAATAVPEAPPRESRVGDVSIGSPRKVDAAPASAPRRRRGLLLGLFGVSAAAIAVCAAGGILFAILRSESPPTPVPTQHTQGAFAYVEEFETDEGGWDVYDDGDTSAGYVDGTYRLGVYTAEYITWANPTLSESFDNFEIEVDMRQVEGPIDNAVGVLVRYQADDANYYCFQISNDGFYSVIMLRDDEWETLVPWEMSDAIHTGLDVVNRVKVISYGDEFDLYVNGTYLTSLTDDTFATGNIGLAAGTFDEPGVVIEFDNLTVRLLE